MMEPLITNLTNPLEKRLNAKKSNNSQCNKMSAFGIHSRSPSPLENIPNGANGSHIIPKPNQVSTVVLYGIPIVSLYIESQERLCLAQISNTLLKQFSYNEIHNRRVALGITCVQCTPVQLEILRRANAMPVSSRRCGMITRREAERLCKSFLGDNSPPRLPDDFSFAVLHECAWGCRGSFLPSRYNSSRAKCIKCSYCGLFFSPNKFIFHSHRVSASDKYIQPDAANFNSWRRHLKLSGSPSDDVQHAWEDVKAMFNGGTRKRLMTSPISSSRNISHNSSSAPPPVAKKPKESPVKPSAQQQILPYQIRPMNISHMYSNNLPNAQTSPPTENTNPPITSVAPPAVRTPSSFPHELPFSLSRSFMIDYMWHHQQQTSTSVNAPTVANKASHFQFPPYSALSWMKQPPPSFLFKPNNGTSNDEKPSTFNHFHSAFKPVINMRMSEDPAVNVGGAGGVNPNTQSPSSSTSSNYNHTTASSANLSDDESLTFVKKVVNRKRFLKEKETEFSVDVEENPQYSDENRQITSDITDGNSNKKEEATDDESEMVDIESTEDDVQILNLQPYKSAVQIAEENKAKIEETGDKLAENTKKLKVLEKLPKNPIHSLKEIVNRDENEGENYYSPTNRSKASPNYQDWSINLKKESFKYDSSFVPSEYIHKIHAATKIESRPAAEPCLTPSKPNDLWSVAKFSFECNNNNNNNNGDDSRFSLYQHFNQIQQKNFQQHHVDVSHSAPHS